MLSLSTLKCEKHTGEYEMLTLEQIRERLKDRRPSLVAKSTGLHINTITAIRDNPEANPTYKVMHALSLYLERG